MKHWVVVGLVAGLTAACSGGTTTVVQDAGPLCASPSQVCAGVCVDTQSDNLNCGACGNACAPNSACVEGACAAADAGPLCASPSQLCAQNCVDVRTDNVNCGRCDNPCPAGEVCSGGTCAVSCGAPLATCTTSSGKRCADLNDDPSSCGTCGTVCPAAPNAAAACVAGSCTIACATGFVDCDGDPANGCEAQLAADASSCGACGNACSFDPGENQVPVCRAGICDIACAPGTADCDFAGECFTDIAGDPNNCGACGNTCGGAAANQYPVCNSGTCGIACDPGFGDCDADTGNGCEVGLDADTANCGACGNACPTDAGPNQATACAAGSCGFACTGSFLDCDPVAPGCEVDGSSDAQNCGGCGNVCGSQNATSSTCTGGSCAIACAANAGNCDGLSGNGCEADLLTDGANCGSCGNACTGGMTCVSGACAFPPAGTLDQSYPYNPADPKDTGDAASAFQTYIAGLSGELGEVDYWGGLGDFADYSLDVYAGGGTGGTKLASLPHAAGTGGPIAFHVPVDVHIPQVAGQTYTLSFVLVSGYIADSYANVYANGCSNISGFTCPGGSAPYDINFQTWVR